MAISGVQAISGVHVDPGNGFTIVISGVQAIGSGIFLSVILLVSFPFQHGNDSFLWPCFTEISHGQIFENPQEFSYLLPSYSPSISRIFREHPQQILEPRRCSHSQKFSKFENEYENSRVVNSRLPTLHVTAIFWELSIDTADERQ